MDLATFLISRALKHAVLANYLCWYLYVECDDETPAPEERRDPVAFCMYVVVLKRFSYALKKVGIYGSRPCSVPQGPSHCPSFAAIHVVIYCNVHKPELRSVWHFSYFLSE